MKFLELLETALIVAASIGVLLFYRRHGAKPIDAIQAVAKEILPPHALDTQGRLRSDVVSQLASDGVNGHRRIWDVVEQTNERLGTMERRFIIYDERLQHADEQREHMLRTVHDIDKKLTVLMTRRRIDREKDSDDT